MAHLLPALLCLGSGFLLASLGWPHRKSACSGYLFRASLSVGFGVGVFSLVFFLSLLVGATSHLLLIDFGIFALLLIAFFSLRIQKAPANFVAPAQRTSEQTCWFERAFTVGFAMALCAALYSSVMRTWAYPHGYGWDAFSIWNLHARFLFLGGLHWRDGFTNLLAWSHPDYPLLLPAAVAHCWSYMRHDDPAVPAVISFLFTFSTVALLFAALSMIRGRWPALLGATALLTTPAFIEQGMSQYADVPLSFFILASIALLCLHDALAQKDLALKDHAPAPRYNGLLALAGLAAGFAGWTKNEGLLFLCALVLSRLLTLLRQYVPQGKWISVARQIAPIVVAALPVLLVIALFKHFIATPGDLFSSSATTFHKLLDLSRYWAIIRWYLKGFFRFGGWFLLPGTLLLIGYYIAAGKKEHAGPQTGMRTSVLTLALSLSGYFAVYLVTPYDIFWHLRFSLLRLFLQLWPSAVFLFFLNVKTSEGEASDVL
jgi:hypothetical protein